MKSEKIKENRDKRMKDSYFPFGVMYTRPGQLTILISTTNRSSTCTRVVGLKEILKTIRINNDQV